MLSDVYSNPNRGFAAAYVLGFAGWAVGAAGTIRHIRERWHPNIRLVALAVAGWGLGALVATVVGLVWLRYWDLGFIGPILGAALGGGIGGALIAPMGLPSSLGAVARASVRGAVIWGGSFLVFQVLAFYAGYVLTQMTVDPLVPIVGHIWAKVPGWAIPAGIGGLLAARCASRLSGPAKPATI